MGGQRLLLLHWRGPDWRPPGHEEAVSSLRRLPLSARPRCFSLSIWHGCEGQARGVDGSACSTCGPCGLHRKDSGPPHTRRQRQIRPRLATSRPHQPRPLCGLEGDLVPLEPATACLSGCQSYQSSAAARGSSLLGTVEVGLPETIPPDQYEPTASTVRSRLRFPIAPRGPRLLTGSGGCRFTLCQVPPVTPSRRGSMLRPTHSPLRPT
mmetsp:Transcript_8101/g.23008  ORF Transcript_8101/g.23008 Transcript_8101/m.23008 type:complete len:209 (+) Transcript_8101:1554-2180(+)